MLRHEHFLHDLHMAYGSTPCSKIGCVLRLTLAALAYLDGLLHPSFFQGVGFVLRI